MDRLTENKIVLVTRHTRLDDLIARFNTFDQAKFYVEHLGADFSDYVRENQTYREAVRTTEATLRSLGRLQTVDRSFLPNFLFGREDTVVVLGQDGLVANTAKYLSEQKIIAINPDPKRWDGFLLPFQIQDIEKIVPDVFGGKRSVKHVTMAEARLNNGQLLYAVNDLFIGQKSHVSARYQICVGDKKENHSSSGVIVSTGVGSTGWLKSLLTGATTITSNLSGKKLKLLEEHRFSWDADYLYYTVREPFPSKMSSASLVFGKITKKKPMNIVSQMPENGVIFSDGIESDFLEFNSGTQATIGVAKKRGNIVV